MNWFKVILGSLLVLWCPVMLMAKHLPTSQWEAGRRDGIIEAVRRCDGRHRRFHRHRAHAVVYAAQLSKDTQRTVIQNFNLSMLMVTMGTYLAAGILTRDMLPLFAIVAPAMLVPTLLGTRMYIGISEARFRQIVLSLLTGSGAWRC